MTQFKTTKGWKHQVALHEDGFTYDSATYKFSDVDYLISESTATYLNGVVHVKQLNDFKFLICLKDGTDLHQGIKLTGKQILMAFGWWAFLSDEEISKELCELYNILLNKTFESRAEKYNRYKEEHDRWLLSSEDGDELSANNEGDIYVNGELFINIDDAFCKIDYMQYYRLEFIKLDSNKSIFEKKLSYTADLRKNADIVENIIRQKLRWQHLMDNQKIHNPSKISNQ